MFSLKKRTECLLYPFQCGSETLVSSQLNFFKGFFAPRYHREKKKKFCMFSSLLNSWKGFLLLAITEKGRRNFECSRLSIIFERVFLLLAIIEREEEILYVPFLNLINICLGLWFNTIGYQWCGSGSVGSICFWASRLQIY